MRLYIILIIILSYLPLYSENGWEIVISKSSFGYQVDCFDAYNSEKLCISGTNGMFMTSGDGGSAWTRRYAGTDVSLTGLHYLDTTTAWICGNKGTIIRYDLQKNQFRDCSIDWSHDLKTICFISPGTGLVGTTKGLVLRTSDAGSSWDSVFAEKGYQITEIIMKNEKDGYMLALPLKNEFSSKLFRTTDGGITWTTALIIKDEYAGCLYLHGSDIWIAGRYGMLIHSTDNGLSWQWFDTGSTDYICDIYIIGDTLYALTQNDGSLIKKTSLSSMKWETDYSSGKLEMNGLWSNGRSLFTFVRELKMDGRRELLRKRIK